MKCELLITKALVFLTFVYLQRTHGAISRHLRHQQHIMHTSNVQPGNSNTTSANKNTSQRRKDTKDTSDLHMACKEIRSKRYLSDGFCVSMKPITEVVCAGQCVPIKQLPWYNEFIRIYLRKIHEWRCVEDIRRRQKVHLSCQDGSTRTYRVKVVQSCKCRKYTKRRRNRKSRDKRHYDNEEVWELADEE